VFYRRFFSEQSPLEFDPLVIMLTSVFLACKVEEWHELTLDNFLDQVGAGKLYEVANGPPNSDLQAKSLKSRVGEHEMVVMHAIGFGLLVEPKPDAALRMLAKELRQCYLQQRGGAPPCLHLPPALEGEAGWAEVIDAAEEMVLDLATNTDAILLWPASVLIAAGLCVALDRRLRCEGGAISSAHHGDDSTGGLGNAPVIPAVLGTLLGDSVEAGAPRIALRGTLEHVLQHLREPAALKCDSPQVKDILRAARSCQRVFELHRAKADEQQEVGRQERKRAWRELKVKGGD